MEHRLQDTQVSVVAACGLRSRGSGSSTELNSCGTQAYMLQGSEVEPVFPALAGGFFTSGPSGEPLASFKCKKS